MVRRNSFLRFSIPLDCLSFIQLHWNYARCSATKAFISLSILFPEVKKAENPTPLKTCSLAGLWFRSAQGRVQAQHAESERFEVAFQISEPSRPESSKLRAEHWTTEGHTDGGRQEDHVPFNHNERKVILMEKGLL